MHKVYIDDAGNAHLSEDDAVDANKRMAAENIERLLCSFGISGIGSKCSDQQVDTAELVKSIIFRRKDMIEMLIAAGSEATEYAVSASDVVTE
jgi:hypothetical protein